MKKIELRAEVSTFLGKIDTIIRLDDFLCALSNAQAKYIIEELYEKAKDIKLDPKTELNKYINVSGEIDGDEIDIKVDIDDFLYECSNEERKYVSTKLKENYFNLEYTSIDHANFIDTFIPKLLSSYHRLSNEDIEKIKEITNKL